MWLKKLMSMAVLTILFSTLFPSIPTFSYANSVNDYRLEVTTDKSIYVYGEPVNITVSNVGEQRIEGIPYFYIFFISDNGEYHQVISVPTDELRYALEPNESYNYVWDQKNGNGDQVSDGKYEVIAGFLGCCGIIAEDNTTFSIKNAIYIEEISGGLGLTVIVKNIGMVEVNNVAWSIEINGLVLIGKHAEGIISSISPGNEIQIKSYVFGIGPAEITVTVGEEISTINCFILGPLAILIPKI